MQGQTVSQAIRYIEEHPHDKLDLDMVAAALHYSKGILRISVYENPKEIYYYIGAATNVPVLLGMYEYEIPAATWVVFENDGRCRLQSIGRIDIKCFI